MKHVFDVCPECDGSGQKIEQYVVPDHHPSCDGSCLLCPIPVEQQDVVQCDFCGGTGQVEGGLPEEIDQN